MKQYVIDGLMRNELREFGRTSETVVCSTYWEDFLEEMTGIKDLRKLAVNDMYFPLQTAPLVRLRFLRDINQYPEDYLCRAESVEKIRRYGQDGKSRGLALKVTYVLIEKEIIETKRLLDTKKRK